MAEALSVILLSDDYRRVQYGLSLALTAAALHRPVSVLFAGPSLDLLTPKGWHDPAIAASRSKFSAHGIATAEELIQLAGALGAPLLACQAAMRLYGIDAADFIAGLAVGVSGLTAALADGQPVVI